MKWRNKRNFFFPTFVQLWMTPFPFKQCVICYAIEWEIKSVCFPFIASTLLWVFGHIALFFCEQAIQKKRMQGKEQKNKCYCISHALSSCQEGTAGVSGLYPWSRDSRLLRALQTLYCIPISILNWPVSKDLKLGKLSFFFWCHRGGSSIGTYIVFFFCAFWECS